MVVWHDRFIRINEYSRPKLKLLGVKKLVLHYTANPGAGADNHFTYFDQSIVKLKRYASAHFFVDKYKALCIIPLNEVAYHANEKGKSLTPELNISASYYKGGNANLLSLGVEMCIEKDGSFHPDTVKKTEDVFVELCRRYKLNPLKDIVRHYDITGKNCPAPWVKDSAQFIAFKNRVKAKLEGKATAAKPTVSKPIEEDDTMFDTGSSTLNNALITRLEDWTDTKKYKNALGKDWLDKAKAGKLTNSQVLGLILEAGLRGFDR